MSVDIQHYFVYAIVGFAAYKLFFPVLLWAINKYRQWKSPNLKEDLYSCYTGVCSRCNIKNHE